MMDSCLYRAVKIATTENREIAACRCRMCREWDEISLLAIDCVSETDFTKKEKISIYQSSEAVLFYFTN